MELELQVQEVHLFLYSLCVCVCVRVCAHDAFLVVCIEFWKYEDLNKLKNT